MTTARADIDRDSYFADVNNGDRIDSWSSSAEEPAARWAVGGGGARASRLNGIGQNCTDAWSKGSCEEAAKGSTS
ncbi:hypothetical protein AB0K11_16320 [Mycobacterium sp. NPDC050551]|uniref:hypothetical protein n=1 Tax=Mycobacterium sp. NPDC050551 TaxID=3155407 RepID=UPI0034377436